MFRFCVHFDTTRLSSMECNSKWYEPWVEEPGGGCGCDEEGKCPSAPKPNKKSWCQNQCCHCWREVLSTSSTTPCVIAMVLAPICRFTDINWLIMQVTTQWDSRFQVKDGTPHRNEELDKGSAYSVNGVFERQCTSDQTEDKGKIGYSQGVSQQSGLDLVKVFGHGFLSRISAKGIPLDLRRKCCDAGR